MTKVALMMSNWIDGFSRTKRAARRKKIQGLEGHITIAAERIEAHNAALLKLVQSEFRYKSALTTITQKLAFMCEFTVQQDERVLWLRRLSACQDGLAFVRRKINIERKKVRKEEKSLAAMTSAVRALLAATGPRVGTRVKKKIHAFEITSEQLRRNVSQALTANSKFYDGAAESQLVQTFGLIGRSQKTAVRGA